MAIRQYVEPLHSQVLVKLIEPVKELNGIIVPDQSQERPSEGFVQAIGPEVQRLQVGDHVIFGKFSGKEITIDANTPNEQKFWLIWEAEIDARIVQVEMPAQEPVCAADGAYEQ
jgi:co-chaperonin GroES (HSP10)